MKKFAMSFVSFVLIIMSLNITAFASESFNAAETAKRLVAGEQEIAISFTGSAQDAADMRKQVQEYVDAISVTSQTPNVTAKLGKSAGSLKFTLGATENDFTESEIAEILGDLENTSVESINAYICRNLDYDKTSAAAGGLKSNSSCAMAKTSLESGLAICQGFANLFAIIAENCDYENVKIRGYVKGDGYHVMNLVRVDGTIFAIDCVDNDVNPNRSLMVSFDTYCKNTGFKASVDVETAFAIKYGK